MKVGLFNTKNTLRARYLLESFASGIEASGDRCIWVDDYTNYKSILKDVDVGVQVCYPNIFHGNNDQGRFRIGVNEFMRSRNRRVLTIDTGFVRNQSEYELLQGAPNRRHAVLFDMDNKETYERVLLDIYYEIGFDGLKRNADYYADGMPGDRWAQLDRPLKPYREQGDHILIIGQTLNGLSSQHINIYDWYHTVTKRIRKVSNRPIWLRHHPRIVKIRGERSREDKDRQQINKAVGKVKDFHYSRGWLLEEDLAGAHAAVVFTSNASVTSVIEGIPTFAMDPACMAWPVGNRNVFEIENPVLPDRTQWANELAYCQWNVLEMRKGLPWQHLRPHALMLPRTQTASST